MASASSGRYQSRLFNFVHQQSRRLTENLRSASRHLQVSTSWGVQLLLYPVYLLFQSKRSPGKQFYKTLQQSWPQLQADDTSSQPQNPPTVDTPIQRVLLCVDALPSPTLTPHTPCADSPNRNRPVVRGIATQLSSRTLVLVTAQNEILDILIPPQEQKLQEQIIGAVADYWRYQRLAHSHELDKASPTLRETSSALEYSLNTYQALAFLDRTFAQVESNYLAPVSEVAITLAQRSRDLVQRVQTQLTFFLPSKTQVAGSNSPAANTSEAHTLQIQALIWAAIDYFFGHRRGKLGQTTPTTNSLELQAGSKPRRKPLPQRRSASSLLSAQLPSQLISDPWLTLSDLFGAPEEGVWEPSCGGVCRPQNWRGVTLPPQNSDSESEPSTFDESGLLKSQTMSQWAGKTNSALPSSQSAGYSVQNLLSRLQGRLPQPKQASGLVKRQKTTKGLREKRTGQGDKGNSGSPLGIRGERGTRGGLSPESVSAGESFNQPCTQSTQLDPAPDWIETNATVMGYVKHPLEQLLEWLDRAMLWLENFLMIVWRWVQQLLRGKLK